MHHQNAEKSAAAQKKLHGTLNAILQMEDDDFEVHCNPIFLGTLIDNSSLISLCNAPLQTVTGRVRERFEHFVSKDDNGTRSENQSPINYNEPPIVPENILPSVENESSDVVNSIHGNQCHIIECNGSGTKESNEIILHNNEIDQMESQKEIDGKVYFTTSENSLSMNHNYSERRDIGSNGIQQQRQDNHDALHFSNRFVTCEMLNFDCIDPYEVPVNHPRNFVVEAIRQLEINEEPVECDNKTPDISTTNQMDIKADVNSVTVPMNIIDLNIKAETVNTPNTRTKRTIKPNRRIEFISEKVRSMLMDSRSNRNAKSAKVMKKQQSVSGEQKMVITTAMGKQKSKSRKTVSSERPAIKEEFERDYSFGQNTNRQMFAKNHLYRTLCVFCNETRAHLVLHYANKHPNYEVPIARPSPPMADKLRLQNFTFKKVDRKLLGICIFCEEKKAMTKDHWEQHFLIHSGEKMYNCRTCHGSMKIKRDHRSDCLGDVVRIYHENSSEASVVGFMCNGCNYLQISRDRIVKHLEVEHGFLGPSENYHYKRLKLI